MSSELPPPPPPLPPLPPVASAALPAPESETPAPQAPKLKLVKPSGFVPPPPVPSAGVPPPPVDAPAPAMSTAGRPAVASLNRNTSKVAVTFDILALVASFIGVIILALELFVKSKG